jgi:DNA-binding NarL/FixJ family response regulator
LSETTGQRRRPVTNEDVTEGRQAAPSLTSDERQVLELLGDGCTRDEIGSRLRLNPAMVDRYLDSAYRKLVARSRSRAQHAE